VKSILVVDDEKGVRFSLQTLFEPDYRVFLAADGETALKIAEEQDPDIAIVDLMMPRMSGLELLPRLKAIDPQLTVIVLSAIHDIPNVVQAIRLGATHYLTKPFDVHEVKLVVEMALRDRGKTVEIAALETEIHRWYNTDEVVGEARPWQDTLSLVQRAAQSSDTTVMFYGESGTGKELLARFLHNLSPRRKAPMIPIHCAAIPETLIESELFGHEKGSFTGATERRHGCIEMADGGTLFLDEIGEMPAPMQSKLLRFLQDHEFMRVGGREFRRADVRVVGATNRDLKKGIEEGWFRSDLYYRLNVVPVCIPPLRARRSDVRCLTEHFIAAFRKERRVAMHAVSPATMTLLEAYSWPGNVRELRNVVERIVVLFGDHELIEPDFLPPEIRSQRRAPAAGVTESPTSAAGVESQLPTSLEGEVAKVERELIRRAVEAAHGNLSKAAVLLQTTRRILKYKADQYGIQQNGDQEQEEEGR